MEALDEQIIVKTTIENKKNNNIVSKILKNNIIFIVGIILIVWKGLLLNYILKLTINIDVVCYALLASMLIMSPTINRKDKFGYIYLNIIYCMATAIIFSNFIYYNYSTNFLSLYQIENLIYVKEIGYGLKTIVNIREVLLFWTDNILLLSLSVLIYSKTKKTFYKNRILKIAVVLIILIFNIIIVQVKINGIYKWRSYNKSLIIQDISIYYYHYEDLKEYVANLFKKEEIDEDRLKKAYAENISRKTTETDYTGIAKNCNVIILQLESLNEYIIGKKVNGKEITPNLNRFFKDNIYFADMYNQGLGTTADSEFEVENSMYPLENGYIFQKYYANTWLDIYTTLREEGYYTSFMHPNTSTFWNREQVYNVGYNIDEYDDIEKFENIEIAGEFYSDEGFFKEAVKIMNAYQYKFCTTLVSVTTHIPFSLAGISNLENKLTINYFDLDNYADEYFVNYLMSCNFVDYAFGRFIEDLEKTDLMKNSILIVYGDHGTGLTCIEDIKQLYKENNIEYTEFENNFKDVHVPFGIKIPMLKENYTIHRTVSKIDIKPTILDLLGVGDKFSIGDIMFGTKDYSFIKGLGYVTSKNYHFNGKCYDRETLQETEESKELLQQMEDEIYLSDTIIKNNLINKK